MNPYTYSFTVFTPTFNRAKTLHRVYHSLRNQTFKDFEWLIVDDGSTDSTKSMVNRWIDSDALPINYIYQYHTGKHFAFNTGVSSAKGQFFLPLDSDDACVPQALERFKFHWDSISSEMKPHFAGVTTLCQKPNGEVIGEKFPYSPMDSDSLELNFKLKVKGERWGFNRTDVLKEFPFPEVEGYVTENTVWFKIALKYKIRCVNESLRIYFSTPGSITQSKFDRILRPNGTLLYYKELINYISRMYRIPPGLYLKSYANYVRFSLHAGIPVKRQVKDIRHALLMLTMFPIGFFVHHRDCRNLDQYERERVTVSGGYSPASE